MSEIPDKEHLLESANDSARYFRNIYLAYLTVMIYILIIVLSTDQELLFRAGDKQLPLIHINVPIVAFFTYMPWALLVLHFYLLIQVTFLSDKVHLYRQGLYARIRSREGIRKAKMLLAPVPLVHILVEEKAKLKHAMLYLIVFVSLILFPLIVLIAAQMKFLPYQDELITWLHRVVILVDVFFLWYFWHHIFGSHKRKTISIKSIAKLLVALALMFVFIAMFIHFPGEKIYNDFTASFYKLEWVKKIMPINRFVLLNRKLVEKEPAPELLAAYIKEKTDLIEPGSPTWCQYADSLDLKDRNFRKAQLRGATLCKAILQNADLTSADLRNANLIGAIFEGANLTDAYLARANLTNADLKGANLTDASLARANLTDASLARANLTDAYLARANLTNASLARANLTDAFLWRANLTDAYLGIADLTDASLARANLTSATLIFSDLTAANLSRTDFSNAVLGGTTIDLTWVWESSGSEEAEANFPIGIPKGWSDTLKPKYLCPLNFDTSSHYDISEYIGEYGGLEREQLKARLKEVIGENCKRYYP